MRQRELVGYESIFSPSWDLSPPPQSYSLSLSSRSQVHFQAVSGRSQLSRSLHNMNLMLTLDFVSVNLDFQGLSRGHHEKHPAAVIVVPNQAAGQGTEHMSDAWDQMEF